MRLAAHVFATWILLSVAVPGVLLADHDLTCHPPEPGSGGGGGGGKGGNVEFEWKVEEGESMVLLLGLTAGGVSEAECSPAQDPSLVPIFIAPDTPAVVRRLSDSGGQTMYWAIGPLGESSLAPAGIVADLPTFTEPDGTPLVAQFNESDLEFLLRTARPFTSGETLTASAGAIPGWAGATILELPAAFTLEELLTRPAGMFAPYTGAVHVVDVAEVHAVPEPGTLGLLLLALATVAGCRVLRRRARCAG